MGLNFGLEVEPEAGGIYYTSVGVKTKKARAETLQTFFKVIQGDNYTRSRLYGHRIYGLFGFYGQFLGGPNFAYIQNLT